MLFHWPNDRVAWQCNDYGVGLATQRVAFRLSAVPLSRNNLRQVVHTNVALSPRNWNTLVPIKGRWCALQLGR